MGAPPVVTTSRAWARRQRALARPADTGASVFGGMNRALRAPCVGAIGQAQRPLAYQPVTPAVFAGGAARPLSAYLHPRGGQDGWFPNLSQKKRTATSRAKNT